MESTGKGSLITATPIALFVGILLIFVPAVGSVAQVVVPEAQETAEGNSDNAIPFFCSPLSQR